MIACFLYYSKLFDLGTFAMWLAGQRELAAWGCDCSCLFCCTRSTLAPTNSLGTASRTASAIAQAPGVPLRSDA